MWLEGRAYAIIFLFVFDIWIVSYAISTKDK